MSKFSKGLTASFKKKKKKKQAKSGILPLERPSNPPALLGPCEAKWAAGRQNQRFPLRTAQSRRAVAGQWWLKYVTLGDSAQLYHLKHAPLAGLSPELRLDPRPASLYSRASTPGRRPLSCRHLLPPHQRETRQLSPCRSNPSYHSLALEYSAADQRPYSPPPQPESLCRPLPDPIDEQPLRIGASDRCTIHQTSDRRLGIPESHTRERTYSVVVCGRVASKTTPAPLPLVPEREKKKS